MCAAADATGGSALDCVFCTAKELPAPLDGSPALTGWRGAEDSGNGEQPPAHGSGSRRPASAAAPVSAPAREGTASADAPGADRTPAIPR